MRQTLTDRFLRAIRPPAKGQVDYWDAMIPGFGLRVGEGGRKSWVLMYRHQNRKRRLTLGTYPVLSLSDAREAARDNLAKVQQGFDPAFDKQDARDADAFNALADRYLREHAQHHKKASSIREDEKLLKRELRPAWGARKARDIRRSDVIALVDGIAERAPISANRVLSLASKIFNFAVSKEVIQDNPAFRIPKPGKEQARDRVLDDDEIVAVWRAAETESPTVTVLFKLLLLTGQRKGEVIGMRWSEVNLEDGWWTLPAERTKNGKLHRVPLLGHTSELIASLSNHANGSDFVFLGRDLNHAIVNLAKPLARIIRRATVPQFTIHDLRRTCATGMARAGVPQPIISKVLNHLTMPTGASRITLVYDRHTYDNQKKDALRLWDTYLKALLDRPAREDAGLRQHLLEGHPDRNQQHPVNSVGKGH